MFYYILNLLTFYQLIGIINNVYLLSSDDVIEREFDAFDSVRDQSPKYVFSLDEYDMSKDGITNFNIEEWLLNKVDVTLS